MDEFPSDVDILIFGTGLPESIVAAAASRLDKSVLQLDPNEYYGRDWAGFRLEELREFLRNTTSLTPPIQGSAEQLLKEGESFVPISPLTTSITNSEEVIYARDDVSEPDIAPQTRQERYRRLSQRHHSGSSAGSRNSYSEPSDGISDPPVPSPKRHKTFEDLLKLSKKFSLDLAPKLFWTTDAFVNLLVSSNISRYTSFRLVRTIATLVDGRIVEVPFSRAGIYNYPDLDAVDKRKVMKFMQLCVEDSAAHQKEIEKTNDLSVGDYLKQKKVPSMTRASIINAIALCSDSTPLVKALPKVKRFLTACGRYAADSSPFLFPIYGCGEYPQYFARISAVFGGIQCLKRGIEYLIMDTATSEVKAVVSDGFRINCKHLVLPIECCDQEWLNSSLKAEYESFVFHRYRSYHQLRHDLSTRL